MLRIYLSVIVVCLFSFAYGQNQVTGRGQFVTPAQFAVLQDFETGTILYDKGADERMYPASMTKILTAYVMFQELQSGYLHLSDRFTISRNAYSIGGSRMFLEVDDSVPVEDLIRGIIVQSGNDASVAVAENIAGTEADFADMMNATAAELGMHNSHFVNASGWPNEDHYTTAMDLLLLTRATIENFPQYYSYYAEREFTYANIRQPNRNPLFATRLQVDGLKTGHTEASGYGLAASAEAGDRRLIMVINGLDSEAARAKESFRLLDWGIRTFDNYGLLLSGDTVHTAPVHLGKQETVPLIIKENVLLTLPRVDRRVLQAEVIYDEPLQAPVSTADPVGSVRFSARGETIKEYPVYAAEDIAELSIFGKISRYFRRLRGQ